MGLMDEKDAAILNLLQENCRYSLTYLSKKVGLSVDSVKKRIERMIREEVFDPKIQLRPRTLGFKNIMVVNIRLHNYTKKELDAFVQYLVNHPRVPEIFALSGEWNFSVVIIAKDFADVATIGEEIRNTFGKIISHWSESLTTRVYKFESYDVRRLLPDISGDIRA